MHKEETDNMIETILAIELAMFLSVSAESPAACQQNPDGFKRHRKAQFSVWPLEALESYLQDLTRARAAGRNIMTEKYAVMQGLLKNTENLDTIEKLVSIDLAWQEEVIRKYPAFMSGARPLRSSSDSAFVTSFETYLRGELSTYSPETLELLLAHAEESLRQGKNLAEELYKNLTTKSI